MKKIKELAGRFNRICCFNVFMLVLSLSSIGNAFGQNMEEYAVKAAFVLNFARYTQWPDESFASSTEPFRLCVLGDQTIGLAFQALSGKRIDSRTLHVHFISRAKDAGRCNMIFISEGIDRTTILDTLSTVKERPVLTIGETRNFISNGGMINLFNRNGRLHFEINETTARKQQLKLSSRLLKLAIIVGDK